MRARHRLWLLALALCLAGCITSPQTPAQSLAYIDSQFTGLVSAAADMRDAGLLRPAHEARLDVAFKRADQALDSAWMAMGQGRPASVTRYLRVLNALMLKITRTLREAQADGRG